MPRNSTRPLLNPASTARHLAVLSEIARLASADLALRPMLQRIVDELRSRFPWDIVELIRIDSERGEFTCEAFSCSVPTNLKVGYSQPLGKGVVGQVATTGEPLVVDDASEWEGFVQTIPDVCSEICVPVRHRGEIVALLNAESRRSGAFATQLPLLSAIADQIAGAIANARLYEQTRRRATALEVLTEVSRLATEGGEIGQRLDAIAHFVRRRFGLQAMAIVISDPDRIHWLHQAIAFGEGPTLPVPESWPIGIGIVGRAVRSGKPELVLDVQRDSDYLAVRSDVRAELVVPVGLDDGTLAALNFEADDPEVFDPDTVSLLQAVGDQIAGAIALSVMNQRLAGSRRELEHANLRLAATNERLEEANSALTRMTRVDGLTGVGNRISFDERLDEEWRRALRAGQPLAVTLVDVDHFKAYNDTYGHQPGDDCLRLVAQLLSQGIERAGEFVARYGGDEFAAILPRSSTEEAHRSLEAVRLAVENAALQHEASPTAGHVTISGGVASLVPGAQHSTENLVEAADAALYRAKRGGSNRVVSA